MNTILIIDDDDQLRKSFERLLTDEGYNVLTAASGESGLDIIKRETPDLVLLDVCLPGMNGLETYREIKPVEPRLPVIIMTAFGTTETAIEATKMGAFDYILKPFDIPDTLNIVKQAIKAGYFMRTMVEVDVIHENIEKEAIIGRSIAMQDVYKSIGRVSPTNATVLIRGDSGTGKELVSMAIYHHSLRSDKPFQIINCVAIPENLLESELFGYEKGSFTGATHRRIGKIEMAGGGTVFLDEIGDMPPAIQAKMLRLLQEKSIERLGGRQTIPVDVRIIAATNRNLEKAIEEGKFREDLYYRLKVVTIRLPSLSERREDIPLLTDYFLARHAREIGVSNSGITTGALEILKSYKWPGNVRELSNIIQKALIFNRGAPISKYDVNHAVEDSKPTANDDNSNNIIVRKLIRDKLTGASEAKLFDSCMDKFAAIIISEALMLTEGNRSGAARLLGLSRPTLHSKIEKYRLKIKASVEKA